MIIGGIRIEPAKLMSKNELPNYLRENGESDRALSKIRDRQFDTFGSEIIWHYPISDGFHLRAFIMPVKEGFISLPYDKVDKYDGELLELDDVVMIDEDTIHYYIEDWRRFSDDLLAAMIDMQKSIIRYNRQQ